MVRGCGFVVEWRPRCFPQKHEGGSSLRAVISSANVVAEGRVFPEGLATLLVSSPVYRWEKKKTKAKGEEAWGLGDLRAACISPHLHVQAYPELSRPFPEAEGESSPLLTSGWLQGIVVTRSGRV